MFVRTENLLSLAIFKTFLGAFYRGWYVVVHLCSHFSIRRQMAPVQSIKFQTVNFPIFCARIIVIFWATCIGREVFSVIVMGNLTHILPVLHCVKRGIAFVSSFCFCFCSTCANTRNKIIVKQTWLFILFYFCFTCADVWSRNKINGR